MRKGLNVEVRKVKIDEARTFGVEIEFAAPFDMDDMETALERAGLHVYAEDYNHVDASYWKIVEDCTVQDDWETGNEYPMELVSPPLSGRAGLRELEVALDTLNSFGCAVNRSCGLHVHHDANDLDLESFRILTKAYVKYEDTLDMLVSEDRRGDFHEYTQGLRRSGYTEEQLFRMIERAPDTRSLYRIWSTRYVKLNLDSLRVHGTVEFRQHEGSLDVAEIVAWISLTQGLVSRSAKKVKVTLREARKPFDSLAWTAGACASVERHFWNKYKLAC